MGKLKKIVLSAFLLTLLLPVSSQARHTKVEIGMPFVHFDVEDVYRQRWVSTFLRGRPIVFLTAHPYQRYEVLRWAEAFRQEYGLEGDLHLLWVVNLRRRNLSRGTERRQWYEFNAPVPLLLDWDGTIGRAMRINYNVPNIIVVDAYGRLAMHEMHTYSPGVYAAISAKIKAVLSGQLFVEPTVLGPMIEPIGIPANVPMVTTPTHVPAPPLPKGKKGDSN